MIETRRKEREMVWDVITREGAHEMVPTTIDEEMLTRAVRRESRAMVRSRVVLPAPLAPRTQTILFGPTSKETPRIASMISR